MKSNGKWEQSGVTGGQKRGSRVTRMLLLGFSFGDANFVCAGRILVERVNELFGGARFPRGNRR